MGVPAPNPAYQADCRGFIAPAGAGGGLRRMAGPVNTARRFPPIQKLVTYFAPTVTSGASGVSPEPTLNTMESWSLRA